MLPGLMQDVPLLTTSILTFAARAHGSRELVSRLLGGGVRRLTYAEFDERCRRAAKALVRLGVAAGDRIATLGWNTHRHLELFYAAPGLGAVLHTVNPRLFEDQIRYILDHGGAEILFVDGDLAGLARRASPGLAEARRIVLLSEPPEPFAGVDTWLRYEDLVAAETPDLDWPTFDENAGACLCYTSGTTGAPKGVLYSHRSIVLGAMGASLNGALAYRARDCILPAASLYHALGWALPYTAPLNGCKLVLAGARLDGETLHDLFEAEGVTISTGVPTIWTGYLAHLAQNGLRPSTLEKIFIGGAALPISMATTFLEDYGVEVIQAWGMTETSPMGAVSSSTPALDALPAEERRRRLWTHQGRLQFGVELKVVAEDGAESPRDGATPGFLRVRGPWIARGYFREGHDALSDDGWLDTGDIATWDADGFIGLTDRSKDLIKSGGEWISSIEIETLAEGCEGVRLAAVIGTPHPKWGERPLLIIQRASGSGVEGDDILAFLDGRIISWWRPDAVVFVDEMPLTATGKVDKRQLRSLFAVAAPAS